ncbi:MAG: nickel-responsive transcriptional regulator NikR [Nitrospirota bacterium]
MHESAEHGGQLQRFGVSIEGNLLTRFDRVIEQKGYTNRSEALRDLIRDSLVEQEWDENREIIGTVTIVYDHEVRELSDTLTDLQHQYQKLFRSTLHIHLDEHNCLEVLVVQGRGRDVKHVADRLIGTKGVKHGKFTMTTTGKDL